MCLLLKNFLIILDIHSGQNDYRFKQEILFHIFMTYTKEKSTDIIASSVNFESFSENFTLYSKRQCYKNFYLQDIIFQKMSHETHPQRKVLTKTSGKLQKFLIAG